MENDVDYVPCRNNANEEFNSLGNELHEQERDHASTLLKKVKKNSKLHDLSYIGAEC